MDRPIKSWPEEYEEIEDRVRRSILTRPRNPIVFPKEVFEMLMLEEAEDIRQEYKSFVEGF